MRKPAILATAAAAAACLASAHALALEPPRPLTGPELQALLTGNTLIGSDKDGFYWMYYADGDTVWGRSAAAPSCELPATNSAEAVSVPTVSSIGTVPPVASEA